MVNYYAEFMDSWFKLVIF